MNLSDYYESLPKPVAPKTDFIKRIASLCNVDDQTVRFWIKKSTKPNNPNHLDILSEETGIPVEKLFE
jgi:hypothetical protein